MTRLCWILGEQTTKSYKPVAFSNNRVATTATTNSTTSVRPTTSSSVTVHPSLGTLSNHQGEKERIILKYSWHQDFFSSFVCNFVVVTQVEYPGLSHQALDLGPNSWSLYLPNLCRGSGVKNKILSVDDTRCVIKPGNPQFSLGI